MTTEQQVAMQKQQQRAITIRKKTMAVINLVMRTYGIDTNNVMAKSIYRIIIGELNKTPDAKVEWMYQNIKLIMEAPD